MNKPTLPKVVCILFVFCAAMAIASPAQILTTLHTFGGGTDGLNPYATPVQATDGNFYGTTRFGGASANCEYGCGTVFKITPSGTLTTLHSFNGSDGAGPYAGLVQASDGNFYGTTAGGGSSNCAYGCGTVFRITPSGTLMTLYSFCRQAGCGDGSNPQAALLQASDGNLYGTTFYGGAYGGGTVFKITPSGTLTTLYSFCAGGYPCADGHQPGAGLVQASDGNFYGTTTGGGANDDGTVFKITPSGTLTTLHSFDGSDGADPFAGLVQASDGNFYGTTVYYGGANREGTVFKITPGGTLTTLYSFCAGGYPCADGARPLAGLVQASDGNFYGTTVGGGANGWEGTVFKITPSGTLTTLHSFAGSDGDSPLAGLVQASDGNFYGTTAGGGAYGDGTVFRLVTLRPCIVCRSLE